MDSDISMKRFENWTGEVPGYSAYISHSVPRLLSSVGEVIVGDLSLGRADVSGQRIVVASNNSPQTNFVIFVDGGNLLALQGDHPVIATRKLEESIHDIRWLNESSVVCATANRNLLTFQLEWDHSVKQRGMIDNIHTGFIREIAVKNAWEPLVASGGYDGCLCISDMSTGSTLQRATLDDCVIGSVKWTELNSNVCVSVTTDDGYYFLYDTRTALIHPAVTTNLMQADLFTHCRYTDHHVLLGYGDGEIKQIDMRKPNHIVCSVTDPFVHGVGDIEFNPDSQSFAISGFADCSVWKIGPDGTTRIHSHTTSRSNVLTSRDVYCTIATYLGPTSVLVSDSLGRLDVIKQAF